jgi:hypothetical protein
MAKHFFPKIYYSPKLATRKIIVLLIDDWGLKLIGLLILIHCRIYNLFIIIIIIIIMAQMEESIAKRNLTTKGY